MFCEGIRVATIAIRPNEFVIAHVNGTLFVENIQRAAKAANGLAHTQANPRWLAVRDHLECMHQMFTLMVSRGHGGRLPRAQMAVILERILNGAKSMAAGKAMPRQDVLTVLDQRRINHKVN